MKITQISSGHSLAYGDDVIDYTIVYSGRSTIQIEVCPDCTVLARASSDMDLLFIEESMRKKAGWILKQLNYFRQFGPKRGGSSYVNGEEHLYLGDWYPSKITQGDKNRVELTEDTISIICRNEPNPKTVKKLLDKWYLEQAHIKFNNSLYRCWHAFFQATDKPMPELVVSGRLRRYWGTYSRKGIVTLDKNLIKASMECIDFIVNHELCHVLQLNHGPLFYELLYEVMPYWKEVKLELERTLL
jgi:predicted metal-dependent hydrolase